MTCLLPDCGSGCQARWPGFEAVTFAAQMTPDCVTSDLNDTERRELQVLRIMARQARQIICRVLDK